MHSFEHQKVAYRVKEVAELTNLGRTTLYKLMDSGELGSFKVGKIRLISARALDEFYEKLVSGQLGEHGAHSSPSPIPPEPAQSQ